MNREVTHVSDYPYRAVVQLTVTFADGSSVVGTGAVVGRNDILTATHVIYNPDAGGWATDLDIAVGVDYNMQTGVHESPSLFGAQAFQWRIDAFPEQTFADADHQTLTFAESQYDVALIGLSEAVGDQVGYFGLAAGFDSALTAYQIGYPAGSTGMMHGLVWAERSWYYGMYEAHASETNELMAAGSSGGPLFVWQDNEALVIGVRSSLSSTSAYWADIGFTYAQLVDSMTRNDELLAMAAQSMRGSPGRDLLFATAGADDVDGGAGLDTLVYELEAARYRVRVEADFSQVVRSGSERDTDTLVGIERIRFADGVLGLDVGPGAHAGSAYRLYQAAFDRQPDQGGLRYWVEHMDAGMPLQEVALRFVGSPEFERLYGAQVANEQLVDAYYRNVLDRSPEVAGQAYWLGRLEAGLGAAEMLVLFSESEENRMQLASVLEQGLWIG